MKFFMSSLHAKQCLAYHIIPDHCLSRKDLGLNKWYCMLDEGHPGDHKDSFSRRWVNDGTDGLVRFGQK